tara:strand:- start:1 stop:2364 length:2364 start_codon:yes stop_codon:yes gene_type:complete
MKETKISVFRDLYKPNETPFTIPLWKSLERIKKGVSKETILWAREPLKDGNKEEYNQRKAKLPCIIFGGEFKNRSKKGLIEHSGLMVIDFDEFSSREDLDKTFELVKNNKSVVALFISPSDNGIKGVVKIPKCNAIDHERYFKAFGKEFDYEYWDANNCNVDRVCYESWDENIYINYDAEIFNPKLVDEGFNVKDKVPLIPINNESDIIDKIMDFDWKKDFVEGERNAFLFDLAGQFCEYGITQTTAEGYILNNVVIGEFSEREALTTIKSAYKKRGFDTKYFEDYNKVNAIKVDLKKGKEEVIAKHNISEDVYDEIKEVAEADDFWYFDKNNKVKISPLKYKLFLEGNGFKKYYPEGTDKPTFVKIQSNKVKETSTSKIKDFVLEYLVELKEFDVWNYCAGYQNLFSDQFLLMLDSIDLMLLKDKINKCFIAFNNGILEITKNKLELKEYLDVQGYIWESHIIDRNWKTTNEFVNDYSKFINNISNNEPLAIESCVGYLLHTYKNRSNNKAIILNDEIITQNPEGGTGKGLFIQGVSNIRKTHIIDGKSHNDKASFQNQSVSLDDKVLVFDDIPKNWSFENQFSLITEGITIRHLYKDPVKLSVQDSPKIVISTNYAVKGEGNSHDRRRHELEFAQYYGKQLTPEQEFGRQLFDEWDVNEYAKFDNYMVFCIQVYLKNGLIKQNAKNLKLRKLMAETSMEFYEWFTETADIPFNQRCDKKQYYNNFKENYGDFKKDWFSQRLFTTWLKKTSLFLKYGYTQDASNGWQWFEITNDDAPKIEDDGLEF